MKHDSIIDLTKEDFKAFAFITPERDKEINNFVANYVLDKMTTIPQAVIDIIEFSTCTAEAMIVWGYMCDYVNTRHAIVEKLNKILQ